MFRKKRNKIIAIFLVLAVTIVSAFSFYNHQFKPNVVKTVLRVGDDVIVTADIYSCLFQIEVLPEKRIPATNNWDTLIDMEIYNGSNTLLGKIDGTTNNQGQTTLDLCDNNIFIFPGTYTFYIKGRSHLRKFFGAVNTFDMAVSEVDFTPLGGKLLAGETSNVYNNYINSLDVSTQIKKLYTSDVKNDLNQDGQVNALDISNTIVNFYVAGDCSPKEEADGIC